MPVTYLTPQHRALLSEDPIRYYFSFNNCQATLNDVRSFVQSQNALAGDYDLELENDSVEFFNKVTETTTPSSFVGPNIAYPIEKEICFLVNLTRKIGADGQERLLFNGSTTEGGVSTYYYLEFGHLALDTPVADVVLGYYDGEQFNVLAVGQNTTLDSGLFFIQTFSNGKIRVSQSYNERVIIDHTDTRYVRNGWIKFSSVRPSAGAPAHGGSIRYKDFYVRSIPETDRQLFKVEFGKYFNGSLQSWKDTPYYYEDSSWSHTAQYQSDLLKYGLINSVGSLTNISLNTKEFSPQRSPYNYSLLLDIHCKFAAIGDSKFDFVLEEIGGVELVLRFNSNGNIELLNNGTPVALATRTGNHDLYVSDIYKNTRFLIRSTDTEFKLYSYVLAETVQLMNIDISQSLFRFRNNQANIVNFPFRFVVDDDVQISIHDMMLFTQNWRLTNYLEFDNAAYFDTRCPQSYYSYFKFWSYYAKNTMRAAQFGAPIPYPSIVKFDMGLNPISYKLQFEFLFESEPLVANDINICPSVPSDFAYNTSLVDIVSIYVYKDTITIDGEQIPLNINIVGRRVLFNIYYTSLGQAKVEIIDIATSATILNWTTTTGLDRWYNGTYTAFGKRIFSSEYVRISEVKAFFGDDVLGFGAVESHIPEALKSESRLLARLHQIISQNASLDPQFLPANRIQQRGYLIWRLAETLGFTGDLLKTFKTVPRFTYWGMGDAWGNAAWEPYYDGAPKPHPDWNQVTNASLYRPSTHGGVLYQNASILARYSSLLSSIARLLLRAKSLIDQDGRTWKEVTDNLIVSSTHPTEGGWYSSTIVTFKLKEPHYSDPLIAYYKWTISTNQEAVPSTQQYRTDQVTNYNFNPGGGPITQTPYYIIAEIYDASDSFLGREEYLINIDTVSPVITAAWADVPLYEDYQIPIDFTVINEQDVDRVEWYYYIYNNNGVFITSNSYILDNPDTSDPNWTKHTFASPINLLDINYRVDIQVIVRDVSNNLSTMSAGYNFNGDLVGHSAQEYVVAMRYKFKFALWDLQLSSADLNSKRCSNKVKSLVLRDECHIREAGIRFVPGTHDRCPNCAYPLMETYETPAKKYFDSNFPVDTPFRGDDPNDPGILRYTANREYYGAHLIWYLDVIKRDYKFGHDVIYLGTFTHPDIIAGLATAHFEIIISESAGFTTNYHVEDSLSGVSGFKARESAQPDYEYIQNGFDGVGHVAYEPTVELKLGITYYYKWRLIVVYPDATRAYQGWNQSLVTYIPNPPASSPYDGTYRETLIRDGVFKGFYQEADRTGLNIVNVSSTQIIPNTSILRVNGSTGTTTKIATPLLKTLRTTNRLVVKLKVNQTGVTVKPAVCDEQTFTWTAPNTPVTIEKDKWTVLSFDLDNLSIVVDDTTMFFQEAINKANLTVGVQLDTQPSAIIDIDYIALIDKSSKRKYLYFNMRTGTAACYYDRRVASYITDKSLNSKCEKGYVPIGTTALMDPNGGFPIPVPADQARYQYNNEYCFNTSCPGYAGIPAINGGLVCFISDPTAPISTGNILEANRNLSGIMMCPNKSLDAGGNPVCPNNFLRNPISPERKICSRHEGILHGNGYKYKCDKYSETDEWSEYDTSGKWVWGPDPGLGSKLPANRIEENGVVVYELKPPTPFAWNFLDPLTTCDGLFRDSGATCGATLVGWSQGQVCRVCGTGLIPFDKYGVPARLLMCSNTNKKYFLIYACRTYQNGIRLDSTLTKCPECNADIVEFYARPIIEKLITVESVTLNAADIAKLKSGMVHTWAVRGWDTVLNIPYAGPIGGGAGPVATANWSNVTQFRPTIGTAADASIWTKYKNIADQQSSDAETRRAELQSEINTKRLELVDKARYAGNSKALALLLTGDGDGYFDINLSDSNWICNMAGATYDSVNSILKIRGDARGDNTASGSAINNSIVTLKHAFVPYVKPGTAGKLNFKFKVDSVKWFSMITADNPDGWFWNPDGNPWPPTWSIYHGSFGVGYFYFANFPTSWNKQGQITHRTDIFKIEQQLYFVGFRVKNVNYAYTTELVPFRMTLTTDFQVITEEGTPLWSENIITNPAMHAWPYDASLTGLGLNVEFVFTKTTAQVKFWKDSNPGVVTTYNWGGTITILNHDYIGVGMLSTYQNELGIKGIAVKGTTYDLVQIDDIDSESRALENLGSYRRDTQNVIDESELIRVGKDTDYDFRNVFNTIDFTETYYRIEFDPKPTFDSRSGKPLRVIEQVGWTCLAKRSQFQYGSAPWSATSTLCPNYKVNIPIDEVRLNAFKCPVCGQKLYPLRIDRSGISAVTEITDKSPFNNNDIIHMLNKSDIPGEAPSDYLIIDSNSDGQQDHITDQTFVPNKFFTSYTDRYSISGWTAALVEANYVDNPDPDVLKLHNNPPEGDGISDVDWAHCEHITDGHPFFDQYHPFGHCAVMMWLSVGRNKIANNGNLQRHGNTGWDDYRSARYRMHMYRYMDFTAGQTDAWIKERIGDLRFAYYIPENLYYRSVAERSQGNNTYPTDGGNQTNKFVTITVSAGVRVIGFFEYEYARTQFDVYDDYQRDGFETNFVKPQSWAHPINAWGDWGMYQPELDIFNKWYFIKPYFYEYLTALLGQYVNPNTGLPEPKTWANCNYVKITVEVGLTRDQGEYITVNEQGYDPRTRANNCGIVIAEIQQGWTTQQKTQANGSKILKYPPNIFDGNYYWRVIPYTLSLNEAYKRWYDKVYPSLQTGGGPLTQVQWVPEDGIWSWGTPPRKYLKRLGSQVANGVLRLSKNWGTILDREDFVLLPEGYE